MGVDIGHFYDRSFLEKDIAKRRYSNSAGFELSD